MNKKIGNLYWKNLKIIIIDRKYRNCFLRSFKNVFILYFFTK